MKGLFGAQGIAGAIVGIEDTAMDKTGKNPCPHGAHIAMQSDRNH